MRKLGLTIVEWATNLIRAKSTLVSLVDIFK